MNSLKNNISRNTINNLTDSMSEIPLSLNDVYSFVLSCENVCFITITLKPKLYKYSSITQLEITNHELYNILYCSTKDFIAVAEHTKQGNIHYHAIFSAQTNVSNILLMNKLKKNKNFGFIKFDGEIKCKRSCAEYLYKDVYNTMHVCRSNKGGFPRYIMSRDMWRDLTEFK